MVTELIIMGLLMMARIELTGQTRVRATVMNTAPPKSKMTK